jgi:hypothetical protein
MLSKIEEFRWFAGMFMKTQGMDIWEDSLLLSYGTQRQSALFARMFMKLRNIRPNKSKGMPQYAHLAGKLLPS